MDISKLLPGLSGYAVIRNAIRGDYPIEICLRSMLPICDEVVVADCFSDDGTFEMLTALAAREPKIRVIQIEWPKLPTHEQWVSDAPRPMNDNCFWPKLINVARPYLRYAHQLHLDGDEFVFPCAHEEIRKCVADGSARYLKRVNWWKDAAHIIPDGWVCGTYVARVGPTELWMPSDEPHPEGEPEMKVRATKHPSLLIGHLGFLRKQDGFFAKSKVMQVAVAGNYDDRLKAAEASGQNWWELSNFPAPLEKYDGEIPAIALPWLAERGRLPA